MCANEVASHFVPFQVCPRSIHRFLFPHDAQTYYCYHCHYGTLPAEFAPYYGSEVGGFVLALEYEGAEKPHIQLAASDTASSEQTHNLDAG